MPYKYNPFSRKLDEVVAIDAETVIGPGSATDDALVRWNGTTGTAVQNSNATLTDAGTLTLADPLDVVSGGTGDASLTSYAVLTGGTTSTGAVQSIASVGTAAQVLTSNGAGALPTFQTVAAAGGGITLPLFTSNIYNYGTFTFTTTNKTTGNGWLEFYPISVPSDFTMSNIGVIVTTAVAGAYIRIGLYTPTASGGVTLVEDFGTVSLASTGIVTTSTTRTLTGGTSYMMGYVTETNSGSPAVHGFSSSPRFMSSSTAVVTMCRITSIDPSIGLVSAYDYGDLFYTIASTAVMLFN